jgi:alpha-galactosidase
MIMLRHLVQSRKRRVSGSIIYDSWRRCLKRFERRILFGLACGVVVVCAVAGASRQSPAQAASVNTAPRVRSVRLALTPPMGWNDWAHYQCGFRASTILENAKALVASGLAAAGYVTVTIDDCWMQKDRDAHGNLQPDRLRFPQGMKPVADAIHGMGLKFGIYEDAGYATCGGFAGSGKPKGGGKDHFTQDARLFATWGVDYLKLDGCNLYTPTDGDKTTTYRKAYAAESAALRDVGRPIVFSESAPAYFQDTPEWYDVLAWVRGYGQLWREGTDIANFDQKNPENSRFPSVLWNYAYNLPLGRFQSPGNWDDADFIIGGDNGMSLAETRSQLALWSMMSAPLMLSSDVGKLSPEAVAILGNRLVIGIDQDSLGKMATLLQRSPSTDLLLKKLSGGDDAVAVLNHGASPQEVDLLPNDLGFSATPGCTLDARDLWSGTRAPTAFALRADVAAHDTAIWRIHASAACGAPTRSGANTLTMPGEHHQMEDVSRCLSAAGVVEECAGAPDESWTIEADGRLVSGGRCLGVVDGKPTMQGCNSGSVEHWRYSLAGNLVGRDGKCLTASRSGRPGTLSIQTCGHNRPDQIWSLPN